MTAIQLKDIMTAIRILHGVLYFLVTEDPWGDKLIANFLRTTSIALPTAKLEANKLNILVLETICKLLTMALREGWPSDRSLPPDVSSRLPTCLSAMIRLSSLPYSRPILDTSMQIFGALKDATTGPTTTSSEEDDGSANVQVDVACQKMILKSLGGLTCGPQLSSDILLHYINKKQDARDYCRRLIRHLGAQLRDLKADLQEVYSPEEIRALVSALSKLGRLAWNNWTSYGYLFFPTYMALTTIVVKYPRLSKDERMDFLMIAHNALGRAGQCGEDEGCFLKAVLKATAEAAGSDEDGVSQLRLHVYIALSHHLTS